MTLASVLRPISRRVIALGALITIILTLYLFSSPALSSRLPKFKIFPSTPITPGCSPQEWADGFWSRKSQPHPSSISKPEDALVQYGFDGCASSREYFWHMGADNEEYYYRFPSVSSWEWTPGSQCAGMRAFDREAMVTDLVEQGGWLLIGDSVAEGHFFSLSCMLYPHVRATPNYTENPYFDRAWPQNLYLVPDSPLVSHLKLPSGFDIHTTPLVTFRRTDYLLSQDELISLHKSLYNPPSNFTLFSPEEVWSLPPSYYLELLTAPLPEANYHTLIVSTAGHWTLNQLPGFRTLDRAHQDDDWDGIHDIVHFFGKAMERWADEVQSVLSNDTRNRVAVARAYLPGHEDCHEKKIMAGGPWTRYHPFKWNWWNWASIKDFNHMFDEVVSSPKYPNIHFLAIDRPGLLRPDAHANSDCLHIATGPGVMEGWSHYIWHFVTREIGERSVG